MGRVDTTARIKGMFVYPHQVEQVMARFEEIKRWQIEVTNPGGIDEMILSIEAGQFNQEDELLHLFREKIKLRPILKVLAPGTLPPQIRAHRRQAHLGLASPDTLMNRPVRALCRTGLFLGAPAPHPLFLPHFL